jgi:hypothetical protein
MHSVAKTSQHGRIGLAKKERINKQSKNKQTNKTKQCNKQKSHLFFSLLYHEIPHRNRK